MSALQFFGTESAATARQPDGTKAGTIFEKMPGRFWIRTVPSNGWYQEAWEISMHKAQHCLVHMVYADIPFVGEEPQP